MEQEYKSNDNPAADPNAGADEARELRRVWGNKVTTAYRYYKAKHEEECKKYIEMLRHEFGGSLPARLQSDKVDVNMVYQTVKTLQPVLYFKNPKVYMKSGQETIKKPLTQPSVDPMTGEEIMEPLIDPNSGQPLMQEFDGVHSALVFQSTVNGNIGKANLKGEAKRSIQDAIVTFFGAVKCGWGNDQGVAAMGDGAPPSIREDVYDDMAYAIRLRPWDVIVDPTDFYHPAWIAVRYVVEPEQLKNDTRLNFRDEIKGNTKVSDPKFKSPTDDPNKEAVMAEYFEVFVKPCAKYPEGKYFLLSEEVKEDFLYQMGWPVGSKTFPVKLLYFNSDPEDGLPMPPIRYIMGHQKAKLNLRNAQYEFVQRTLPMLYINEAGMKNAELTKKQILSGSNPRVVTGSQPAAKVFGQVSFPALPTDFSHFEANVDNDVARVMGLTGNVAPATEADQIATGLKIAASSEQVRQQENADCVSDFMKSILEHWVDLWKENAAPENFAQIDDEPFPVKWSRDEIQGDFNLEIKPFSMSYEDPVIVRRQWIDLLNILSAPPVQMGLQQQGSEVNIAKICKRILETYDERDVDTFVQSVQAKPEMQVMDAMKENEAMANGDYQAAAVLPEDNHKVHILIHGLMGEIASAHILEHQQAMMGVQPGSPGGGNPEGLPTNGVATDQEALRQPLNPSIPNQKNAINHAAKGPNTR